MKRETRKLVGWQSGRISRSMVSTSESKGKRIQRRFGMNIVVSNFPGEEIHKQIETNKSNTLSSSEESLKRPGR